MTATAAVADTSVFIAQESGRSLDTTALPQRLVVSAITIGELRAGVLGAPDTASRERRLRTLLATAQGPQLAHGIDALLGSAWDDELEPYREAGEGAPVTWLHQVV